MISITEIVLIIAGFAAIILGYLLPVSKEIDEEDKELMEREIRELVRREVQGQKETIENMVDDTVEDSIGRTERAMERISNEKLSAINEYSDTVISDIHKNHDEVMFMYDMLNDKHKNLTSVVSEVTKKADEAKQAVRDAEATVKEAQEASNSLKNKPVDDAPKPIEPKPIETKVVEPEPKIEDIKPQVIKPEEASSLHIIGNEEKKQDKDTEQETPNAHSNAKVVPITEAVRVESRSVNPDKNMRELTANDPISQNRQILEMHKAGKSNMVIARELGLGIGEVKLVIDLSNKHRKVK
ncbi:MAG: hypothetical protein IKO84_09350 [Butyrivibrio sp.]|nr:hypothetical protein [Butyrivibrio sp.]